MARPRKDSNQLSARDRMIVSFWALLRDNNLHQITVGMIVEQARCNRGSFYYHYADMDCLARDAIKSELSVGNLPFRIFIMSTGAGSTAHMFSQFRSNISRLSLAMSQGGYGLVSDLVFNYLEDTWTAVLCDDERKLTPESRFILTYTSGGVLRVIEHYGNDIENATALEGLYIGEAGGVAVRNLCSAQNMSIDELMQRLRNVERFDRISLRFS